MTPNEEKQLSTELTAAHQIYEKKLLAHAFFKVHDQTLSDDLVQDTFMKTWSYLLKGGKVDTMRAFLYHILNNLIVDEYRKHKTQSLDVLLERGYDLSMEEVRTPYTELDGRRVAFLVESLPKSYRDVLRLRYMKGLSLSEMALVLGVSKKTIAVQVHRGLKKLATLYNPYKVSDKVRSPFP